MQKIFINNAKSPKIKEISSIKKGSWLHVERPDFKELSDLAENLNLDLNLLKDGIDVNESPRIELEDSTIYIFTRFCLAEKEQMSTAPLLIILAQNHVITISSTPFSDLSKLINSDNVITTKRTQLVLQILSIVSSGYKNRINQASKKITELRTQFSKAHIENENFASFIDIEEDLTDFLFVLEPMDTLLQTLLNGRIMRLYEDDRDLVEDLKLGNAELTQLVSSRLRMTRNIREAYTTIVTNNLNKIFKRLTSIAIFVSLINVVTGFYGMNVILPLMHKSWMVWIILTTIVSSLIISVVVFQKKKWL